MTEDQFIMVDFSSVEAVMKSLHLKDRAAAERIYRINQGEFYEGVIDLDNPPKGINVPPDEAKK